MSDMIESQDELHKILQTCFKNDKELIDKDRFLQVIQDSCSEIFLFILIFLLEKKPFSKSTLKEFKSPQKLSISITSPKKEFERKNEKSHTVGVTTSHLGSGDMNLNSKFLIKSPKQNSKFAPSEKITNSPSLKALQLSVDDLSLSDKDVKQPSPLKNSYLSPVKLKQNENNIVISPMSDSGPATLPIRKNRNLLKNIDDVDKKSAFKEHKEYSDNIEITKAVKQKDGESGKNSSTNSLSKEIENVKELIKSEFGYKDPEEEEEDIITHSGYLLKIATNNKLKKVYFKLVGKDLYCKLILIILFIK